MALIPESQYPSTLTATATELEDFMAAVSRHVIALNRSIESRRAQFDYDQDSLEASFPGITDTLREYIAWTQEVNTDFQMDITRLIAGPAIVQRWRTHANELNNWADRLARFGVRSARVSAEPPDQGGWSFGTWAWVIGGSVGAYFVLRFLWRRYLQPTGLDRREELRGVRYDRISPKPPTGRSDDGSSRALRVRRKRR